jgi:hypothetical protein
MFTSQPEIFNRSLTINGAMRIAYKIPVEEHEGKRTLGR